MRKRKKRLHIKLPKLKFMKNRKKKRSNSNNSSNQSRSQKVIDKRKGKIRRQKNFFLSTILIILLWTLLGSLVYFVNPDYPFAIPAFFLLVATSLVFTFSFLLVNTRRGLIVGISLTVFLLLRYFGVGHVLNLVLIIGLAISAELYLKN